MEKRQIVENLVKFVAENFSVDPEDIDVSISLVDQGIIDSMGLIEISGHLQSLHGIAVNEPDLNSRNFGSILAIADFVTARAAEQVPAEAAMRPEAPIVGSQDLSTRAARQRELMANRSRADVNRPL